MANGKESHLNTQIRKIPKKLKPVDEEFLSGGQDALARLRADIVENTYPPETKLKFYELTQRYGLGIGTIRESLSQLLSEGFVTLEPGKGFRVAPVSRADLSEITEHYVEFETRALSMSIAAGDDEWEAHAVAGFHRLSIVENLSWQERMRRHGEWVARHRKFREALVESCPDRWLLRMRSLMFNQMERYRFLSKMKREKSTTDWVAKYRVLLDAALARDSDKATKLLQRYLRETSESILAMLPR